jgi:hypothetical protein
VLYGADGRDSLEENVSMIIYQLPGYKYALSGSYHGPGIQESHAGFVKSARYVYIARQALPPYESTNVGSSC